MNALKRISAVALCIAMFSVVFSTEVFAAEPNPYEQTVGNAEFSVSTSFCATGETTKIFVDIEENSQMSAGLFTLTYDTSMLKALNIETGLVLKNGTTSKNITNNGTVKVAYADVNPTYDEGRLFEVEFEAIGDVPQGAEFIEIPVTLTVSDLRNYEDYKIASTVTNGKITLINTPYGDVNLSGDVTATDALITLYANSQLIELEQNQAKVADVNGDAKISAADALLILQYSAGVVSNYPIFTMEAPTGLVVDEKNETSINLLWDVSRYVIGYNVYMDGNKINDEIISENNYTVNGLTQDTRYNFEITSINALKESEKSRLLEVSTDKAERNVTFKDYDGTILDTQIVLSGQAAVLPKNPTRKGYTFTSWDGDTEHIITDAVFTAQYKINTYTVTFDYQYNNQTASDSAVYLTGVSAPALIARDQFTLEGWYQDKNYVKKWNFDTDVIENNMTLYANWVTWSEWTTDTSLLDSDLYEVETKEQYSYSDKSTDYQDGSSTKIGWTYTGTSEPIYGSWTNANWTSSKPTESDTLRITDTKTVTDRAAHGYILYYYYYPGTSARFRYKDYGGSSGKPTLEVSSLSELTKSSEGPWYDNGTTYYGYWNGTGVTWFFDINNSEQYPQSAITHTEWYYQTRSKTIRYYFYKWSAYSDWSDTVYTDSDTRQVKTRTVYRYKLKQQ